MKTYDLSLGNWGPFNKEYYGICHIGDYDKGKTFNVELFPGFYKRTIANVSTCHGSDIKMWGANADLTHFVYRYEIEWKDKVYCDAHFNINDDKLCTITCHFVNNTDKHQSVALNLAASLQNPYNRTGTLFEGYKSIFDAICPEETFFCDAIDYERINCAMNLASDGKYLGETEIPDATGKMTAVGEEYFYDKSHFLEYTLKYNYTGMLGIRYKITEEKDVSLKITVNEKEYRITLNKSDGFTYKAFPIEPCNIKKLRIETDGPISIDAIGYGKEAENIAFVKRPLNNIPEVTHIPDGIKLSYPDYPYSYEITTKSSVNMIRTLHADDIGRCLQRKVADHVNEEIFMYKENEGYYKNFLMNPLYLPPHTCEDMVFTVVSRKNDEEQIPEYKENKLLDTKPNKAGERYKLSADIMSYTTLLNVMYPIYTRRGYIRHNAPGKIWDCLYSWDSGFIGMGLSCMDFDRAYECLNTYLTPIGDIHSPYIFHGSVVPTQIFQYKELCEKYPDKKDKLKELYPLMVNFYKFYYNMRSYGNQVDTGLLKTWHLFYNSGGWDDYPPQQHLLRNEKKGALSENYSDTTPVITTAMAVLISKIMKYTAISLGFYEDVPMYDEAILTYSKAIQDNAYDEETGYFSYMVHKEGKKPEILRFGDGTNYNCGFDGIYPFIAGITDNKQDEKIIDNIKNGLETDAGVGVVDKRAPYYTPYGYWNGAVWMPHQWVLYKTYLDRGMYEEAFNISTKALDVWASEVDETYHTFENFSSANLRGAGFTAFSGLSTPVIMWYNNFFVPGNISTGFFAVINSYSFNENKTSLTANITSHNQTSIATVCLKDNKEYKVTVNGKPVDIIKICDGSFAIPLNCGENEIIIN